MDDAGDIAADSLGSARKRILFVDDDPAILRMLSRVFSDERHRWDLVFALGAYAGLAELRANAFDLLVTDFQMRPIDGRELLSIAKREFPHTARMMMTGSGVDPATVEASIVLQKPPHLNELRIAIETLLAH